MPDSVVSAEQFTPDERRALAPYFTNLDRPVFALTNLPEVVKGALFARYSRSAKSVRRLFLDEFLDTVTDGAAPENVGIERAERLYERVFGAYGAARRRAHRLRRGLERPDIGARARPADGLSRTVDTLCAVHRPPWR